MYKYTITPASESHCVLQSDMKTLSQFMGCKRPFVGDSMHSSREISPARLRRLIGRMYGRLEVSRVPSRADNVRSLRAIYPNLSLSQIKAMGFEV